MGLRWKDAALSRSIRVYHALNLKPLRWLVRTMLSYQRRDALMRSFQASASAAPDLRKAIGSRTHAAAAAPIDRLPPRQLDTSGRRAGIYSIAVEAAVPQLKVLRRQPGALLELEPVPFWGTFRSSSSRFIVQLPRTVGRLDDAEIEGDCLGIFSGQHFVSMFLTVPSPHCFAIYNRNDVVSWGRVASLAVRKKRTNLRLGKAIFIDAAEGYGMNYFHAQVDVAASLVAVAEALTPEQISQTSVLLPSGLPKTCELMLSLIARNHGLPIVPLLLDTLVTADALYFSPYTSRMPDVIALDAVAPFHVHADSIRAVRRVFDETMRKSSVGNGQQNKRPVYMTRRRLRTVGKRFAVNGDAIAAWVEAKGGLVVSPEMLDLEGQMDLMAQASIVLCEAGGAVANALFCTEGTPFLILTHAQAPPGVFTSYLQALKLPCGFVYGRPIQAAGADPAHLNFEIFMRDLERAFDLMSNRGEAFGAGSPDGWH